MLNANLPPFATTPFACHTAPFFCCLRCLHRGTRYILPPLLSPRKTVAPRGTAGQRLRGIFNADSWLVPRSIGVRLCRELRLAWRRQDAHAPWFLEKDEKTDPKVTARGKPTYHSRSFFNFLSQIDDKEMIKDYLEHRSIYIIYYILYLMYLCYILCTIYIYILYFIYYISIYVCADSLISQ